MSSLEEEEKKALEQAETEQFEADRLVKEKEHRKSQRLENAASGEAEEKKSEGEEAEGEEEKEEEDEDEMPPKQKFIQICISTGLLIAAYLINRALPDLKMWQRLLIYLIPYLAAGFDVLREAGEGISHGEVSVSYTHLTLPTICSV